MLLLLERPAKEANLTANGNGSVVGNLSVFGNWGAISSIVVPVAATGRATAFSSAGEPKSR